MIDGFSGESREGPTPQWDMGNMDCGWQRTRPALGITEGNGSIWQEKEGGPPTNAVKVAQHFADADLPYYPTEEEKPTKNGKTVEENAPSGRTASHARNALSKR
jgi:hypothetical protein